MTFEKHLDLQEMFDDIFEKCKTIEELHGMQSDLIDIIENCYWERWNVLEEDEE